MIKMMATRLIRLMQCAASPPWSCQAAEPRPARSYHTAHTAHTAHSAHTALTAVLQCSSVCDRLLAYIAYHNPSLPGLLTAQCSAQCVHCTVFFPFDRARWDTLSNLETVILLNIYLSQRTRSKGTMRKLDFREPQTLNL